MILSFPKLEKYGRLGNQLFEIASTIGLANRYNAIPKFPKIWQYKKYFHNIPDEYFEDIKTDIEVLEDKFEYIPDLLERVKDKDCVSVTGTLQSEKYWLSIRKEIKKILTPKEIAYLGDNSVGIHVRRGDYVNNPGYVNYGPEYYLSTIIKYFNNSKYKFYICSDNIEYCKKHFIGNQFIFGGEDEVNDLKILAGCNHHIICNSSFSWWGAYLSNSKLVIRPPKIFAGKMEHNNENDFWIDDWVCHSDYKIDLTDTTFIIPVKYDHQDRKENLKITTDFISKCFDTNIIIGEQNDSCFKSLGYRHINFPYKEFHRTKILNRMTELSTTQIVINWDADVLFSPFQVYNMVKMLREDYDFVYPYDGKFLRVGEGTYKRSQELIEKVKSGDIGNLVGYKFVGENDNSVGGTIGYKKESFITAGMENENFIAYTPEDVERYYRFKTLGYNIGRIDGALYHLNHFCGPMSSTSNPFYQRGIKELDKVKSMDVVKLKKYISTWEWLDNRKYYLVCYADDKFKDEQNRLISLATSCGMFDDIFSYDRKWLVKTTFYKDNKDILNEPIGGGCCAWKPFIILDAMSRIRNNDIILYIDSADIITGDIRSYLLQETKIHDIILTDGAFKNSDWAKMDCFKAMKCDTPEYMDAIQLEAGVCIFKKTNRAIGYINRWMQWCTIKDAISAKKEYTYKNTTSFKEHRYDQSILTNLKIKHHLHSSNGIRKYVTCNVELTPIQNSGCTFIIPIFYDGKDRKNNIEVVLKHIKILGGKVIIGEQLDRKFEYLQVDKYIWFDYHQFHRTKMINEMVKQSDTDIVAICDADVVLPEKQYYESINLISGGVDVVYPYSQFIKLSKQESGEFIKTKDYAISNTGINSLGGIIFFNKKSYIEGGMENENFIIWGREDLERYHRFSVLGYKIVKLDGNLYHLHHYRGINSSPLNSYFKSNSDEYNKVRGMTKPELIEYVATWKLQKI